MASTVAKIRFVRCPKCFKLLPEFAHLHMYQCGSCGAVLQAKNSNITNESTTSGSSETDSNNASINLEKRETLGTDEKRECASDDTNLLAIGSKDENGGTRTKSECSFSEEEKEEKSPALSKQGSDILRPNDKLEAQSESSAGLEEEILDSECNLSSPATSCSDNGPRVDLPSKYHLMSRRTFRHQWSSGSGCSRANEGEFDEAYNEKGMTSPGSESFYSLQSCIEPEKERPTRSLSKEPSYCRKDSMEHQNESNSTRLKELNHNRAELMKLVEALKHQLGGAYRLKEEKKRAYQPPHQSSQMPFTYQHRDIQSKLLSSELSSYYQKARPPKRFCRPVSGGAPFVVCYRCFEVLRMPADFLISTRRLNKLKCGACSEILKLPFPARAHEVAQASVEYGNSSEDPISFSEEYGISFAESGSTEIYSDKSQDEKSSDQSLHQLMGYPSARYLLH